MLPYIATYLFFAAILAVVDRLYDRPLFIRTHLKHFPWKLNYSFRWWGVDEYWAGATALSLAGVPVLLLWHATGGRVSQTVAVLVFGLICLSSTVLSARYFRLVQKFKTHAWWMTVLTALSTLGLAIVANAYADSYILNRTRVDPAQFPLAERALTTILLIGLWAYIGTLVISLAVGVSYVLIAAKRPTFIGRIRLDPVKNLDKRRYIPSTTDRREAIQLIVVAAGACTTVMIALNSWTYILRHTDDVLQESLVFASFHLHPKDCAIPGRGGEVWVALVNDDRAVVATPAKRGYAFETVGCEIQPIRSLEKARVDRLKLDHYQ
jgi:hypothetical protein